ncbi:MAG: tRNA (N6-isopentenyl adenosine(37)-C2)-methylthiotransferase MiaB [Alphaproteobacteria bacterium]|nr:tRNA (N6-isopentenyl adenosine(37)-C2)-methylthiotransferase MiaB [Alphaproteobacteria bacterium]
MRFYIKSYGCQMNVYDSQRMEDLLVSLGHKKEDQAENANLLIFNTCSIREKADDKLFSDLGRAKILKDKSTEDDFIIVVAGCVAQTRPKDLLARHPYVDMILGPQDIQNISDRIHDLVENKDLDALVLTNLKASDKFEKFNKTGSFAEKSVSEYLTIQEGCDNFCTYCVVPHTRGREFSRSVKEIMTEAKSLVANGVKEITLLGQNVNSYDGLDESGENCRLSRLLWELSSIEGLKRLRYTTSNPKDVDEEIAKAHRDIDTLMPFLHLPVQSGSNEILRKMNRKYGRERYFEVIDMLRSYRSDMAFSSDFIVGFPGETDKDFEDTLDLVKKVQFSQAYSFKYSPRPNTPAAKMKNQISEEVKTERLQRLQHLLNQQQSDFNALFVGRNVEVLLTKEGRHSGQLAGRSEYFQAVTVNNAKALNIGDIVKVRVTDAVSHSLIGGQI